MIDSLLAYCWVKEDHVSFLLGGDVVESTTAQTVAPVAAEEPSLRVISLHDMGYCERLFYLTEVEDLQHPTGDIYAGRRLHDDVTSLDDETPERRRVEVSSEVWGLTGKVDATRRRDGQWVAYEHKRGRCLRDESNHPQAWRSDRLQAIAYAVLLEELLGESVPEARVRYHAENVTAFVTIDDVAREELRQAIARARELRRSLVRPPVTDNERLCPRCSLAPVCLPEEERLNDHVPTLFPSNREQQTLHVVSPKAHIGRSGQTLVVTTEEGKDKLPIEHIDAVVIHGFGQITTQAIHLCAQHGVSVQWLTAGGRFAAGTTASPGKVQQRIRQFLALVNEATRLRLAKTLVRAKVETQLRYLLRATRTDKKLRQSCRTDVELIRETLRKVDGVDAASSLLGLEGTAARAYFASLPRLLSPHAPRELVPTGRSRHPPRDCFNCLLSFGYALIQSTVQRSILAVGLEPALGFYHQPRTAAAPLVLDLMELFRTPLWEMPLIGSINRGQWSLSDFEVTRDHVWLSAGGRSKALQLFEQRLEESYRHPHTGQSLSYSRIVELEVRLLEKEWTGCPGLFAQWRLR